MAYSNLRKYNNAIKTFEKTINLFPEHASAYYKLGELYFKLGNLEKSDEQNLTALEIDKNHLPALILQGKIKIEKKDYKGASKSFKKSISLDLGNPRNFLWDAYANYLELEYSLTSENKKYEESIITIISNLNKALALSIAENEEEENTRAYILYFLSCFYLKNNDTIAAIEKLKKCIILRSSISDSAQELLNNIWNYRVQPTWWRWWLSSPLYTWHKRIIFFFLSFIITSLLLFHPLISEWISPYEINWSLYILLILLLVVILASPSIQNIKIKDYEVELRSPPPIEPDFLLKDMAEKIKKMISDRSQSD